MKSSISRRTFLGTTAVAAAAHANIAHAFAQVAAKAQGGKRPLVVASANGMRTIARAMELIRKGLDPLDAVVEGITIVEDDPKDQSVGLGGLPNEEGVVELDASTMHGPTHRAGSVAAIRNIKNPSRVALLVGRRTDHELLVGEGALKFARNHGFKEENLLTDESREAWLKWRENLSDKDNWLAPPASAPVKQGAYRPGSPERPYGTINCLAVTANGDIAGCTSTSGLAFKLPGRVGDSPIIGAGLYVDNGVGAAGSTGRGEANLQNCSSFAIVELMRNGRSPAEACMEAMQRVSDRNESRLKDKNGRPTFDLKFYAVSKDGRYGSAVMFGGERAPARFAVHDGTEPKLVEMPALYEGPPA